MSLNSRISMNMSFSMKVLDMYTAATLVLVLIASTSYGQSCEDYYDKGIDYGTQGKFEQAQQQFKKALAVDAFCLPAKVCLDFIDAVFKKEIKKETAIHLFRAATYDKKEMWDNCIEEQKKAIAMNPNYSKSYVSLAVSYLAKGMVDDAIAELKKAITINPKDAGAHYNLGTIYGSRKMWDESIKEHKRAIAINPNFAEAHNNLAVTYYFDKQYKLAIKHCDKAIELGFPVPSQLLEILKPL